MPRRFLSKEKMTETEYEVLKSLVLDYFTALYTWNMANKNDIETCQIGGKLIEAKKALIKAVGFEEVFKKNLGIM